MRLVETLFGHRCGLLIGLGPMRVFEIVVGGACTHVDLPPPHAGDAYPLGAAWLFIWMPLLL